MAGFVFVSLISNVVDLEPGMTDCFHVGELILGLQLTDDLNDLMSASAAHLTVTYTWMNTHTELKLPADPCALVKFSFVWVEMERQVYRSSG